MWSRTQSRGLITWDSAEDSYMLYSLIESQKEEEERSDNIQGKGDIATQSRPVYWLCIEYQVFSE